VDGEVFITSEKPLITGQFVQVRITDAEEYDLYGTAVISPSATACSQA